MSMRPDDQTFRKGDEVVLALGTYPGTAGVFLRLKEDASWADITERSGEIRSHPVKWLAHSPETILVKRSGPRDNAGQAIPRGVS